jgi:hypothetical protein
MRSSRSDRSERSHPYGDRGSRGSYGGQRESFREDRDNRDRRDDRYSRTSPRDGSGGHAEVSDLGTLKAEWEKLAPFRSVLPECVKLLGREIAKLEGDDRRRY